MQISTGFRGELRGSGESCYEWASGVLSSCPAAVGSAPVRPLALTAIRERSRSQQLALRCCARLNSGCGKATGAALQEADVLVISAGSSVSTRDLTSEVINHLGAPGVLVHGVAVKPGKPTILGVCDGKPVLGLPGNPVSALAI